MTPWVYWRPLHLATKAAFLLLANSVCRLLSPHFVHVGIVDKKGFQRQRFGKKEVANVVAAYCQVVKTDGLAAFYSKLYRFKVRVHGDVNA